MTYEIQARMQSSETRHLRSLPGQMRRICNACASHLFSARWGGLAAAALVAACSTYGGRSTPRPLAYPAQTPPPATRAAPAAATTPAPQPVTEAPAKPHD